MTVNLLKAFQARLERMRVKRLLRDQFESQELRHVYEARFGIVVGMYSYGCFDTSRIPRGTRIGRYCSFAPTAIVFNANHGMSFLSMHPFLYNPSLGMVDKETISRASCTFEDDVWVGHGAVILPAVRFVGRGAVIAAGAVVVKDVPPYAIVAGNPAVLKRYRFPPSIVQRIEETRWWLLDRQQLAELAKTSPELMYDPKRYFESENQGERDGPIQGQSA